MMTNLGDGKFDITPLPNEAQLAPVNSIISEDLNQDGNLDLLVGGNLYVSEVETGRADAGTGVFFKGDGKGQFDPIPYSESGLFIDGDVKDLKSIQNGDGSKKWILVTNNDDAVELIQVMK